MATIGTKPMLKVLDSQQAIHNQTHAGARAAPVPNPEIPRSVD